MGFASAPASPSEKIDTTSKRYAPSTTATKYFVIAMAYDDVYRIAEEAPGGWVRRQ